MTREELVSRFAAMVGMSETELLMRLAVDDNVVRGIVNDQRTNPVEPRSFIPERDRGPAVVSAKGNGWIDEQKLEMPLGQSGQDRIAEICDHFLGPAARLKGKP